MSNKLIPFFEVNGKKYELKTTRHLRVLYADKLGELKKTNQLDEDKSIDMLDFNRFADELAQIGEKFENAKDEYFNDIRNKDKKETYQAFKELYTEMLEEMKSKKEEMKLLNENLANQINIYEEMIVEAIVEQYETSKKEAERIWKDFVDEIGMQNAQTWIVSIGQEMFESEVQESGFLEQRRLKMQKQAENRKRAIR